MIKLYLDNCCYNRPFDNLSQKKVNDEAIAKLFVQNLIKFRAVKLYYSFVSLLEIFDSPYEEKRNMLNIGRNKMDNIAITQKSAILSAGMHILNEHLGSVESEMFIMLIKQSDFDYTKWQSQHLYNDMSLKQIFERATNVIKENYDKLPETLQNDLNKVK